MTFHNQDEINKLIAEIDKLLVKAGNPLSKLLSGQGQEEREVLERVRGFLTQLNLDETSTAEIGQEEQTSAASSLITRYVEQEQNKAEFNEQQSAEVQIKQTAEQLKEEISVVIQPLQDELASLLEEKNVLTQEVKELEQRRQQNYSLTQQLANQDNLIKEFIQVLTNRLVPNLIPHLTQNLSQTDSLTNIEKAQAANSSSIQTILDSTEGLERLSILTRDLDQRLLSLDGTVNVVFEALERNIHTYSQSLSQSLSKMHDQGMEGEQLMANLVNNLHQYLKQQPSDSRQLTLDIDQKKEAPVKTTDRDTQTSVNLENIETSSRQETKLQDSPTLLIADDINTNQSPVEVNAEEKVTTDNLPETQNPTTIKTPEQVGTELRSDTSVITTDNNTETAIEEELNLDKYLQQPGNIQNLDPVFSDLTEQAPLTITDNNADSSIGKESSLEDDQKEEPEIIENLDVLLSHLNTEKLANAEAENLNTPTSEAGDLDQVDEIYASLFGSSEQGNSEEETSLPDTNEVSPVVPESVTLSSLIETQTENLPPSSELAESEITNIGEDNSQTLQENEQTENLPLSSELAESEITNIGEDNSQTLQENEQTEELWERTLLPEDSQSPAEFATAPQLEYSLPDTSDTITVLTDLVIDVSGNEEVTEEVKEVVSAETNLEPLLIDNSPASPVESELQPTENFPGSDYITASPDENLLSLQNEDRETGGIPQIVVDENQLQQLNQDLERFDLQLNSELEPTDNLASNISENRSDNNQQTLNIEIPELPKLEDSSISKSENIPLPNAADLITELDESETAKNNQTTNLQPLSVILNNEKLEQDNRHNSHVSEVDPNSIWYLGIDLGTTGISAALFNRSQLVVYPIYWSTENKSATSFEQSFRLPAEVYLPIASIPHGDENRDKTGRGKNAAVAQDKNSSRSATQNLYSTHLKPFLQVAIPYRSNQQKWEPVLQLNEFSAGPLIWVLRSLSKLLLTLKSDQTSTTPALIAHGLGIEKEVFLDIISKITGVICTCPSNWSEQYRFNVREAILTSQLVSHAQQIFFVEEAIATLLPELDLPNSQTVQLRENQGLRLLKNREDALTGNTLTLNIGTATTEMALVDVPTDLSQLTYRDFMLHSFNYAGKALEQDIICQLLLPPKSRQPRDIVDPNSVNNQTRPWQPAIPGLNREKWSSLNLSGLELPRVGDADVNLRIRLQQRLESSLLGQGLLAAAAALKLILQHQESFTLELADQRWLLQRRDLETQIFVPYVRRLNRELNKLLVARGTPTEAINQAILSGGVASVTTVNRWLRQKLPNARIIQDLYLGENGTPNCSRVAYGLTMLPLYPQVLEVPRQQYTDYFLFNELLKVLSDRLRGENTRSISFGEILQLFENRGINTRICQQRLLAFLEGELPAGLVPEIVLQNSSPDQVNQTPLDSSWLTQKSQENPDYLAIASTPLFAKQGNLSYRPNPQQLSLLRGYLDSIQNSAMQSLDEPYAINFPLVINS